MLRRAPIVILLGFFCFSAIPAHADRVFQVSGTLISVGNSVPSCPPTACAEIINFSFLVSPEVLGPGTVGVYLSTSLSAILESFTESGPLTLVLSGGSGLLSGQGGYVYFAGGGDEIDLNYLIDQSLDVTLAGGLFYACTSATCLEDFSTKGIACVGPDCGGLYDPPVYLVDVSISQLPEPSSRDLLFVGFCSIFVSGLVFPHFRRRPRPRPVHAR